MQVFYENGVLVLHGIYQSARQQLVVVKGTMRRLEPEDEDFTFTFDDESDYPFDNRNPKVGPNSSMIYNKPFHIKNNSRGANTFTIRSKIYTWKKRNATKSFRMLTKEQPWFQRYMEVKDITEKKLVETSRSGYGTLRALKDLVHDRTINKLWATHVKEFQTYLDCHLELLGSFRDLNGSLVMFDEHSTQENLVNMYDFWRSLVPSQKKQGGWCSVALSTRHKLSDRFLAEYSRDGKVAEGKRITFSDGSQSHIPQTLVAPALPMGLNCFYPALAFLLGNPDVTRAQILKWNPDLLESQGVSFPHMNNALLGMGMPFNLVKRKKLTHQGILQLDRGCYMALCEYGYPPSKHFFAYDANRGLFMDRGQYLVKVGPEDYYRRDCAKNFFRDMGVSNINDLRELVVYPTAPGPTWKKRKWTLCDENSVAL